MLFLELEGEETLHEFCFKLFKELLSLYQLRRFAHQDRNTLCVVVICSLRVLGRQQDRRRVWGGIGKILGLLKQAL